MRYAQVVPQQGVRLGELVSAIDAMGVLSKRQRAEEQIILEKSGEAKTWPISRSKRRRPFRPNVRHYRPCEHTRVHCLVEAPNTGIGRNHRRSRLSLFPIERAQRAECNARSKDAEAGLMQIMITITQNNRNPEMFAAVRRDPFFAWSVPLSRAACGEQISILVSGADLFRRRRLKRRSNIYLRGWQRRSRERISNSTPSSTSCRFNAGS